MDPGAPVANECPFCRIVRRDSPAHIVYEDDRNLAFLDLFPYTRGHLLVVPKPHFVRLLDLPEAARGSYLSALATVCQRVERLSAHYNISFNQGALAGQVVFHLHAHVIPRYDGPNPFQVPRRERLQESVAAEVMEVLARR
jgi:histidine triad (HIT) family protein